MGNDKKKGLFSGLFNASDFSGNGNLPVPGDGFDIFGLEPRESHLFLDRFSEEDIRKLMKQSDLQKYFIQKSFNDIRIQISRDSSHIHHLEFYEGIPSPAGMLVDLRLSESRFVPPVHMTTGDRHESYDMIVIEWLTTRNPKQKEFSAQKPQLPGQKHPGLGCLRFLVNMMAIVAKQISRDGFLDVPDHFHLALMYARNFLFYNPRQEGTLRALIRDLHDVSLSDLSWGAATSTIIDTTSDSPYIYTPSEQIFPSSRRLKKYFDSRQYREIVVQEQKRHKFILDQAAMQTKKQEILKTSNLADI